MRGFVMKKDRFVLLSVVPLFLFWGSIAQDSQKSGGVALVVPATESAVNLAFDLAEIRSVQIVSYERDQTGAPFLHTWDASSASWRQVSPLDVSSGGAFSTHPAHTIALGPSKGIPTGLARALSTAPNAHQIPTLESAIVINKLDGLFSFSGAEWRWLGKRHGLDLYDRNYDQRRWGKYGPPQGKQPTQPPVGANLGSKDLEPVEVVDLKIEPTTIKTSGQRERSPGLRIEPGEEIKLTGSTVELEVMPVIEDAPTAEDVSTSDVRNAVNDAISGKSNAAGPNAAALPSRSLLDEEPILDLSVGTK
ncbi:MAG: hypothetical protein ACI9OU_000197 [Candidatus Promineifilaceae bacterium]|jgi:hypothetical protein